MGQCIATQNPVTCICGAQLEKIDAAALYTGDTIAINCDVCAQHLDENAIIWDCPQEFNEIHPDGYDICNECYIRGTDFATEDTELTQHLISNSNNPSETLLASMESIECKKHDNCLSAKHFSTIMKQYNENHLQFAQNMDKTQLIKIMDDYLHLIHKHDTDQQFELIVNSLGCCNIANCQLFRRNYQNRMTLQNNSQETQTEDYFIISIMDKMHCYFQHCFDIGNRLSIEDKITVDDIVKNKQKHEDNTNDLLFHKSKIEITKITQQRRKIFDTIYFGSNDKIYTKYNQLFMSNDSQQNKENGKGNMYNFGILFVYEYEDTDEDKKDDSFVLKYKKVDPKYASFKEELMQNPFATLNIDQYHNEYEKASILFNSHYCKTNKDFQDTIMDLTLQHLLSLMIYCNYTDIQYEFSKTYREKDGENHQYFYHWGSSMDDCINFFGTKALFPSNRIFYHGIDKQMYFPSYIGEQRGEGLCVYCPLSTSSSFEVATNFAAHEGLIIELQLKENEEYDYVNKDALNHYLPVFWLSDFGNEKEHLFIQGSPMMIMTNINDINTGYEYGSMLKAISLIKELFDSIDNECDVTLLQDDSMQTLMRAILEHRLSALMPKYKPIQSLSIYGKQIVDTFFEQRTEILIHYWNIRKYYSFISDLCVYSDFEGVKLDHLFALCPNAEVITICRIKLHSLLFENILEFLCNIVHNTTLSAIVFRGLNIKYSEMMMDEVINQYATKYNKYGANICTYPQGITINRDSKIEFITKVVADLLWEDAMGVSKEVQHLIQKLILNRLSNSNNDDNEQIEFNKWCDEQIEIEYRFFASGKTSFLQKLLSHSDIAGWIQMDKMNKLFPNMTTLQASKITVSRASVENILAVVDSTNLKALIISDSIKDELKKLEVVEQYKNRFATIYWTVSCALTDDETLELRFEKCQCRFQNICKLCCSSIFL